ncbi:uncharacterized protein LOC115825295 [Chanos chanos]|uniref:Uncharacterized protein LOC115825295 n=1 Tax=Chanos chanos TaxID=29144 RepID=A0A6J2WL13_CHACN|nr:uncharacterized protein LOC115825295 [Chanos chanos]
MAKYGCPPKFISMVKQFQDGMQASVQDNGETFQPFPISDSVKQGCVPAPTLFSLMFSAVLTDAFRDDDIGICLKYHTDGQLFNLRRPQAKTKVMTDVIRDFLFADDCALNASSEADFATQHQQVLHCRHQLWTVYQRHAKKLNHFHTMCLRKILNIKRQDRVADAEVLAQADFSSIYTILMQSQLRWAGRVPCIRDHWLPKRLFYGELQHGQRSQGGQKKRFKESLKASLKAFERTQKNV